MSINPVKSIRQSLARRICFGFLAFVLVGFLVVLGYIFTHSRRMVLQEAYQHGEFALGHTAQRVKGYLNEVEDATHNMKWVVLSHMQPDSLLAYSRRVVEINPNVNSCSITTEPDYFPEYGRYFSAYSVRQGDSIVTVREGEYEYFEKVWYKTPRDAGQPVWVDPFDDFNEGTLSSEEVIASYCVPLYDEQDRFIGVLSTDISLPRLSRTISAMRPYPNSYSFLLGKEGHYFVHPDTTRLVKNTIFTDVDPNERPDLIALGHEMMDGHSGIMNIDVDGQIYVVFYQPLQQAGWSLALVCMEDDVLAGYNHLQYIILPLIFLGLLVLAYYCIRTVKRFVEPVNQLASQASHIADGHFDERMPLSNHNDVVGRLQSNFAAMQQSLDEHVGHLNKVNKEAEKRNLELKEASEKATEADRQKTAFLREMLHQIRTPLNIILGFLQVMRDNQLEMSQEERSHLTATMLQNANSINRMVNMLVVASHLNNQMSIELKDKVNCCELARECATFFNQLQPVSTQLVVDTQVPADLCIKTHREYLTKSLNELLLNAKKFSPDGPVTLRVKAGARKVMFQVEDRGPGIPEEAQGIIFNKFTKLDSFSDGLGLGLTLTQQCARLLNGSVYLDTSYKMGACFVMEIPLDKS